MNRALCFQNLNVEIAVACPKCDTAMEKMDGGYTEHFSNGEYDQTDHSQYWRCPNCGCCMDEFEPAPMTEEDWLTVFAMEE